LLFRSGATPMLTPGDQAQIDALGLKAMIDLRSSEERVLAPTRIEGVRYEAVGYPMARLMRPAAERPGDPDALIHGVYRGLPTLLAPQLRIVFQHLLAQQAPLAFNCSAGQDRTGFTAAMVLSALGVSRDVIMADYHLSSSFRRPPYELPPISPALANENPVAGMYARMQKQPGYATARPLYDSQHRAYLEFALAEIQQRWGSVDAYLAQEIGVGPAEIAKLRSRYLE
jgi:protein-tyrosine phosphatase